MHVCIGAYEEAVRDHDDFVGIDTVIVHPGISLGPGHTTTVRLELVGEGAPEDLIDVAGKSIVISSY